MYHAYIQYLLSLNFNWEGTLKYDITSQTPIYTTVGELICEVCSFSHYRLTGGHLYAVRINSLCSSVVMITFYGKCVNSCCWDIQQTCKRPFSIVYVKEQISVGSSLQVSFFTWHIVIWSIIIKKKKKNNNITFCKCNFKVSDFLFHHVWFHFLLSNLTCHFSSCPSWSGHSWGSVRHLVHHSPGLHTHCGMILHEHHTDYDKHHHDYHHHHHPYRQLTTGDQIIFTLVLHGYWPWLWLTVLFSFILIEVEETT